MIPNELRELFDEFLVEAREHLENLENKLLELEKDPDNPELLNAAFRSMHTLKGGAGFLGLTAIVETAHKAEDILGKLKEGKMRFYPEIGDVLLKAVDFIKEALRFYEDGESVEPDLYLIEELKSILEGKKSEVKAEGSNAESSKETTLDKLLKKYNLHHLIGKPVEEILEELVLLPPSKRPQEIVDYIDKILSGEIVEEEDTSSILPILEEEAAERMLEMIEKEITPEAQNNPPDTKKEVSQEGQTIEKSENTEIKPQEQRKAPAKKEEEERVLRIDVQKIEDLMKLVGELVLDRNRLMRVVGEITQNMQPNKYTEELESVASSIDKIVGDLQLAVMKTRMQPVKRLFQKFTRVVRDLSKVVGKEVELIIIGEDTEMDKSILEKLEEPLVHIIRNALDHGIEPPEERKILGKPRVGKIILKAYYQGDRVYIEIEDDGRGIDPQKVAQKALEKGLITKEQLEKMTEKEILQLVFIPGFSTKDQVSEISGRGVGMDAVMNT
ncbi:chemotaxis protein CheA, partial [Sulfurihydrogenibium yellowstonense]